MKYSSQRLAGEEPCNQVHVIRHDAPGEKAVAPFIEVEESFADHFCESWVAQMASAVASIQVMLNPRSRESSDSITFVTGKFASHLSCGSNDVVLLELDLLQYVSGK